jgi:phosphatidylserine/phosphatidylglycerophosphate/cardiolipin synthase-like enzyme
MNDQTSKGIRDKGAAALCRARDLPQARRAILQSGVNAWRIEQADKLAFLVDGDAYFFRLAQVLPHARRQICIVGWDFDPDIRLRPNDTAGETLGGLLRRLVEQEEELEIRILVWAMGPIYSSHSLKLFTKHEWANHPRIHLRFDARHALRGSHHQKLICVDGATAFVGGIDLTAKRWDTVEHTAHSPQRTTPDGELYGPVHDIQAMFSGKAASAVGELVCSRWKHATDEEIEFAECAELWPDDLAPEMSGCKTAIVRGEPSLFGRRGRHECIKLTHDAVAAARRHIYIETQYLASFGLGRALAKRLRESEGPEIVVLVTRSSRGIFEQFVMGRNRDRLIRRLKRADAFGRLRVMYAVVPDEEGADHEVLIHSKVLVIDDDFVRVGSSNLNNRSEGLDTECDIAVEARSDVERAAIAALRNRLLAEHLDTTQDAVAQAIAVHSSLVAALDRLNTRPRGLRPIVIDEDGGTAPLPGTGFLDPKKPFWPFQAVGHRARALLTRLFGRIG